MSTADTTAHPGVLAIRPEIRALSAYRLRPLSGQSADVVRLHQNEAPEDWPQAIKREIARRLVEAPWHHYPSGRAEAVCEAIGRLQGTPGDMVAPASGSNGVIWAAFAAFAARGSVVMPQPTYSMARLLATAAGARVVEVPLGPGFALDAEALLAAAHARRAEAIYLASPNNPTGNALDRRAVEAVLEGAPGAVILDEAYWEFARATWLDAVPRYPRLVLVRTFSKAMAGAGLRLGWMTAQAPVIAELAKVLPPDVLNVFTQVAAPVLVEHREVATSRIRGIIAERGRVAAALEALGMRVHPSETNFLLFEPGFPPAVVWEHLAAHGVLVRDVSTAPHLASCLRVSIGTPQQNDRFLAALAAAADDLRRAEARSAGGGGSR
ncbi:MAG: histidinol-phosphate transaminase [Armatimonadota bacterium]|nr:histidinol-phosphate transaminase [Armatimonadota bacterium]